MAAAEAKHIYELLSLADLVTLLNLFLGFSAVIALFQGNEAVVPFLILLAALGDALDGFLARKFGASSLGGTLDSLADLVVFGMVPALLLYRALALWPPWGAVLGGGYVVCGALRLARFHLRSPGRMDFQGLPITAGAFTLFLLILAPPAGLPAWGPGPAAALLSSLMVSNLRYPKLDRRLLVPLVALSSALLVFRLVFPAAWHWAALTLLGMMALYLLAPVIQRSPAPPSRPREEFKNTPSAGSVSSTRGGHVVQGGGETPP